MFFLTIVSTTITLSLTKEHVSFRSAHRFSKAAVGITHQSDSCVVTQKRRNKATQDLHIEPQSNTHGHPLLTRMSSSANPCLSTCGRFQLTNIRFALEERRLHACQIATEDVPLLTLWVRVVCARLNAYHRSFFNSNMFERGYGQRGRSMRTSSSAARSWFAEAKASSDSPLIVLRRMPSHASTPVNGTSIFLGRKPNRVGKHYFWAHSSRGRAAATNHRPFRQKRLGEQRLIVSDKYPLHRRITVCV